MDGRETEGGIEIVGNSTNTVAPRAAATFNCSCGISCVNVGRIEDPTRFVMINRLKHQLHVAAGT